ncbi:MAG: FtsW/RodA/SpoVE family cell cycle protein [Bacteroidales bacterium]|nr:FtsW/RodA/SpoVE family cell cycle protein [Bacteroidales bacterium]
MNRFAVKGDKVIWMIAIIFSIASLLVIYSSTEALAYQKKTLTEVYLFKQVIIMILGLGLLFITHHVRFTYYSRIGQIMLAISIPLLIATFFIGSELNSATRTLKVNLPGIGSLSLQPFDLAKLALILYIARFLAKSDLREMQIKEFFLKIGLPILLVTGFIVRSNFSTSAMIFMVSMVFLYIGKAKLAYLLKLVGVVIAGFLMILMIDFLIPKVSPSTEFRFLPRAPTWGNRLLSFAGGEDTTEEINPQVLHSKIAVAQGGLLGKMPGKSTQRNFLPLAFNDYVYAIIVEEYGLIGGVTVVMLFMILLFRSIKIARKCKARFGSFLVVGISLMMVTQALLNMAVAVNLMPITGQPLPFLSMGGTSFWFSCIGIGIILSVSRSIDIEDEPETEHLIHATA